MKKALKAFIIVLSILLLIFVVLPVLYLSLNHFEYDEDPMALAAAEPLASAERYTFNAKDKTMSVKIDKSDLYWFIVSQSEGDDIFSAVDKKLGEDLSLERLGLEFSEKDQTVCVNAKLKWKGLLPLPIQAIISVSTEKGTLSASVNKISLGKWVHVSTSLLASLHLTDLDLELGDFHPFFKAMTDAGVYDDGLLLVCSRPLSWLMDGVPKTMSDYTLPLDLVKREEIHELMDAVMLYAEDDVWLSLDSKLDALTRNPGRFPNLKAEIMAIAGGTAIYDYPNSDGHEWNERLLPELENQTEALAKRHTEIVEAATALYNERSGLISAASAELMSLYCDGKIKVKDNYFYFTDTGYYCDATTLSTELDYRWFQIDTSYLMLASNPGDYLVNQLPGKLETVPVIVFKTLTGRPVVAFQYTADMLTIMSMSADEYEAMSEMTRSGKTMPVYDLGKPTTKK